MNFRKFIEPRKKIIANVIVTFVEAAAGTWAASGFAVDKLAIAGAVGAGVSAMWNLALKPYLAREGW